jgi:hypothetical protein
MRVRLLTFTVVSALVLLGACGDDDGGRDTSAEATAFCEAAKPVQDFAGVLDHIEDRETTQQIFTSAEAALGRLSGAAPEAIREDLAVVSRVFADANAALEPVGYDVYEVPESDSDAINALDDPSLQRSSDNIQAWAEQNCRDFS